MLISELFKETGVSQRKMTKAYDFIKGLIVSKKVAVVGAGGIFKTSDVLENATGREVKEYLDLDIEGEDLENIKTTLGDNFARKDPEYNRISEVGTAIMALGELDESMTKDEILAKVQAAYNLYNESRKAKGRRTQRIESMDNDTEDDTDTE
jgi:hypothetical protein